MRSNNMTHEPADVYAPLLRRHGLKITARRQAIIGLFAKHRRYFSAAQVHRLLRRSGNKAGVPSVYRILEELARIGILIRIDNRTRQLQYALCTHPAADHHHFICRKCRSVAEVGYCNFAAVSRFVEKNLRATVESHMMQIEGLCSQCRTRARKDQSCLSASAS